MPKRNAIEMAQKVTWKKLLIPRLVLLVLIVGAMVALAGTVRAEPLAALASAPAIEVGIG